MFDPSRSLYVADDLAKTPDHTLLANYSSQLIRCFNTVFKWNHKSFRFEHRVQGGCDLRYLPCFHCNEHKINGSGFRRCFKSRSVADVKVPFRACHVKSAFANGLKMFSACNEDDIFTGQRKLSAKISANASG